ncbi:MULTISPECIES: helix-turn-helix domain-containing protein [Streptomyces]|uniref:helix-turn-helix domain-containing protein n=1 Tax=Streptomyces TaxID=1883 RepID=UPI002ED10FC1|nr:helix-turn-helix transcriptional regulator [Streptomyces sp. NBC_00826]WTH94318.1 helix-turn-helix transcriptional regulator [Streptomyces sp. NBC_00825]WTI03053.1 helix-turn-helix transcriptional regulator [Streptomyces sp. NBC_00822]
MSDYQTARIALGARLRELRAESGLTGKALAARLGWPASKVSKIETGKQSPTGDDLRAWAGALDVPEAVSELLARLRSLETHYAAWRRQLAAGVRARQEAWQATESASGTVWNFESAVIPGLLQTAEYARHMFIRTTTLHRTKQDIDAGVNARMQRQQALYTPGRTFHFMLWEPALHMLLCPRDVMAGQLDRLAGVFGMSAVHLAIVPLGAALTVVPTHGFWIFDERLVMVETIGAELRLTDAAETDLYRTVWRELHDVAVTGREAHRLVARARASLGLM